MGMLHAWRNGHILRFIGMLKKGRIQLIGVVLISKKGTRLVNETDIWCRVGTENVPTLHC